MLVTQNINVMFMRRENTQSENGDNWRVEQTGNNGVKLLPDDKA